jgi:hypothetical protein
MVVSGLVGDGRLELKGLELLDQLLGFRRALCGLLLEAPHQVKVLLQDLSELMGEVDQIVGVDLASLVGLAVAVDVGATKVLLIEEHHNLVVCLTDHCPAKTERHVLSPSGVDVNDTVPHVIVIYGLGGERLRPIGEVLLIQEVGRELLYRAALELDSLVPLTSLQVVLFHIQFLHEVLVEGIETHLDEGHAR